LNNVIEIADLVLLMSVNPGFGGQKFIPETYQKIAETKELILKKKSSCLIEIDGGVDNTNAEKLYKTGADILVAGNAVFSAQNPEQTINDIRSKRI
jgi:ribulose-phosphate 3-epimerase